MSWLLATGKTITQREAISNLYGEQFFSAIFCSRAVVQSLKNRKS